MRVRTAVSSSAASRAGDTTVPCGQITTVSRGLLPRAIRHRRRRPEPGTGRGEAAPATGRQQAGMPTRLRPAKMCRARGDRHADRTKVHGPPGCTHRSGRTRRRPRSPIHLRRCRQPPNPGLLVHEQLQGEENLRSIRLPVGSWAAAVTAGDALQVLVTCDASGAARRGLILHDALVTAQAMDLSFPCILQSRRCAVRADAVTGSPAAGPSEQRGLLGHPAPADHAGVQRRSAAERRCRRDGCRPGHAPGPHLVRHRAVMVRPGRGLPVRLGPCLRGACPGPAHRHQPGAVRHPDLRAPARPGDGAGRDGGHA